MNEKVRKELEEIPLSYPEDHLSDTYYCLLSPQCRDQVAQHLLRFIKPLYQIKKLSEDEKARIIYETISRCMVYDHSGKGMERYTYMGGLIHCKAVCMGIAELFTLLGSALGLKVITVIGYGGDPARSGGLHAWNQVWIDSIPYHVDLTWDLSDNYHARGGYFKFYLKSDDYMENHDHQWLRERYVKCPRDKPEFEIPRINPDAIQLLCQKFQQMRRSLAASI